MVGQTYLHKITVNCVYSPQHLKRVIFCDHQLSNNLYFLVLSKLLEQLPGPTFIEVSQDNSNILFFVLESIQLASQLIIEALWENNFKILWTKLAHKIIMRL